MSESWLPISGYIGLYEVSDRGRVRSVSRKLRNGHKLIGRIRSPQLGTGGYTIVCLCRDGEQETRMVHRLVLEEFIGAPKSGHECCHNDGDRLNNNISNLRWDTSSNNSLDSIKHGNVQKGERHWNAKLCDLDVWLIRNCETTGKNMAEFFGVSQALVSLIKSGKCR